MSDKTTTGIQQYRIIRAAMLIHGVTNQQIAKELGVTENYVSFVINGRRVGYRIRKAIADACGVGVAQLWTDENSGLPRDSQGNDI